MPAGCARSYNRGDGADWYESMSFADTEVRTPSLSVARHALHTRNPISPSLARLTQEGMTAAGRPPSAELLEEVEDEFGTHFGPDIAARLRRVPLRWGSSAVGGGAKAAKSAAAVSEAGAEFLVQGRGFAPWCDDEHLGDTLASDPTGTTAWHGVAFAPPAAARRGGVAVAVCVRVWAHGHSLCARGLAAARYTPHGHIIHAIFRVTAHGSGTTLR